MAAAAWAFLDACCGMTTVGVIGQPGDTSDVDTPTSPVVRSHLAAVLGDMVPGPAWQAKTKTHSNRAAAFASYLESVAAQIRADLKAG
jgi:hypothetical protein